MILDASPHRADAVAVGRRKHPRPVVLLVDAAAPVDADFPFYVGNNKVWLANKVSWP